VNELSILPEQPNIQLITKIQKTKMLVLLKKFCLKQKIKIDSGFLLESWEPSLKNPFFLKNYLFTYNFISDNLTIEIVPSLELLTRSVETYTLNIKKAIIDEIRSISFRNFELLLEETFHKVPWTDNVHINKHTRDGGIDFEGVFKNPKAGYEQKFFGQAKHTNSKVTSEDMRLFIGSIQTKSKQPAMGIYVSLSGYTTDAKQVAKNSPIHIIIYDIEALAKMMIEHNIGISNIRLEGKTIDTTFWREIKQ